MTAVIKNETIHTNCSNPKSNAICTDVCRNLKLNREINQSMAHNLTRSDVTSVMFLYLIWQDVSKQIMRSSDIGNSMSLTIC